MCILFAGRLSKEEIEKMVRDAERYKEEDDKQRDRLQAKNALESYAFNMKQTIEDEKLKDKISDDDRKAVLDKCNDVIAWIDSNQVANIITVFSDLTGWLGSRVVSVLDSGAEGPGFKSQPRCCQVTVLGKLFTPIMPLFAKQRNWQQPS